MSRIGRHTLVYGAGILLSKVVAFVMLPVYTRYLTPADYGVLQLLQTVLEVASIVAGSRLGAGIFRFYHKAESVVERRRVLSTALLILVASYCVAAAAMYALAPAIAALVLDGATDTAIVRLAGMTMAFESLLLVPFAYMQLRDRSLVYVVVGGVRLLLQVALNVTFIVYLHMGASGVFLSTLVVNALTGTALAAWLLRDVGLAFSRRAARDLLRFGLPFVGTQVATFVLTFGDRLFLKRDADTAAVGVYGLAYQFGFLLAVLGEAPFTMVWDPARYEIAKRPDRDELYARAFIYFNMLLVTTGVLIVLFVGDFLRMVATPAFVPARDFVPIIVLAYVMQSWTIMHNIGMQIRERTEFYTLANWGGAFVALAGYAVLIPRFLGLGAALATLASFAVREILVYQLSQRLWPVGYRWKPVAAQLAAGMAACGAGVLLPELQVGASIAVRALLFAAYLGVGWRILSSEDRAAVRRIVGSRMTPLAVAIGR